MQRPTTRPIAMMATACALLAAGPALAQKSPYYLGISQSLGHESNLYRIGGGIGLPAGAQSESDTVSTTSVIAGVDQTWGRQRLSGTGALRVNRFSRNDQLNNEGYNLGLGLDWATVDRLSGRLAVNADRSLRGFDPIDRQNRGSQRILENNNQLSAVVRLGVVTRLTAEASANRRSVRFNGSYNRFEYDQGTASLGMRYRLGGAATVGAAWRETRIDYLATDDPTSRRDIDLTANWDPSGLTTVYARISHTRSDRERRPASNFSGLTGELRGSTQATGKIRLSTLLARELGQGLSTFNFQGFGSVSEFNRVGTRLRLSADYALSSKIALNASAEQLRRSFDGTVFPVSGDDRTRSLALGAQWTPTRAIQTGCNLSHDQRSVERVGGLEVGNPFTSTSFSCYGQFVLQ